jgi:hypothetical protein
MVWRFGQEEGKQNNTAELEFVSPYGEARFPPASGPNTRLTHITLKTHIAPLRGIG